MTDRGGDERGMTPRMHVLFFGRLFVRTWWRMSANGWAFLVLGMPVPVYLGAALKGTIGNPFPFDPWPLECPALLTALSIEPIEAFGRRGEALPLLQRRFAPIWSGTIFGFVWALWHSPAFLIERRAPA